MDYENGEMYKDNDERSMFFCRGVLETVKKLGWKPDVIHCQGWMASLMPLYIKKMYNKDPHFSDTKVVVSLYDTIFENGWDKRFSEKLSFDGFDSEITENVKDPSYLNVLNTAIKYADGVTVGSENLDAISQEIFDSANCAKLAFVPEENQSKVFSEFFDKIIEEVVTVE